MYSNTNSKLPKIYARQKLMKKSYLEVLSEARKGVSKASPLKTLIELNRERKLRESREKILKHLRLYKIKTGTLIMGVRCKDGVVIGSDRKIIRGGETSYSDKIFTFDIGGKILFAAEGLTGIRDDFFLLLDYEISRRRGVDTLYELKIIVEDIISELTERYKDRVRDPYPIGVLMGGLEKISEGKAVLYYIHSEGFGEQVSFRCAGHGGDYAYSLAKFLCGPHIAPNLSAEETARRVAFTIAWVAEDVDTMVGGDPDVYIIKDQKSDITRLSEKEVKGEVSHAKNIKKTLPELFFSST